MATFSSNMKSESDYESSDDCFPIDIKQTLEYKSLLKKFNKQAKIIKKQRKEIINLQSSIQDIDIKSEILEEQSKKLDALFKLVCAKSSDNKQSDSSDDDSSDCEINSKSLKKMRFNDVDSGEKLILFKDLDEPLMPYRVITCKNKNRNHVVKNFEKQFNVENILEIDCEFSKELWCGIKKEYNNNIKIALASKWFSLKNMSEKKFIKAINEFF
jgi:hypothetical protein